MRFIQGAIVASWIYISLFLLKLLEGPNWAGVLSGPTFSILRALSITFPSRPTIQFKLWLASMNQPLKFHTTSNLESFQLPQEANCREDMAASLPSCSAVLIECSETWPQSWARLPFPSTRAPPQEQDQQETNRGRRKRHCYFNSEKTI